MSAAPGVSLEGNALLVTGTVDAVAAPALRRLGESLIARVPAGVPGSVLTVNLAGLSTASSVLLSLLLCWQRAGAARGLELTFASASEDLMELARLNGVAGLLTGLASDSRHSSAP